MSSRRLTAKQRSKRNEEIVVLYGLGANPRELAVHFGLGFPSICRILRDCGLENTGDWARYRHLWTYSVRTEAMYLDKQKLPASEIARLLSVAFNRLFLPTVVAKKINELNNQKNSIDTWIGRRIDPVLPDMLPESTGIDSSWIGERVRRAA